MSDRASSRTLFLCFALLGGAYIALLLAMLIADASFTSPGHILAALKSPEIQFAIRLSLYSCSVSAFLSLLVAVPLGYLLSRTKFPGKTLVDALLDVPIVLPPVVVGLSLLILFQTTLGQAFQRFVPITFTISAVILAQFTVAAAYATRTMQLTFDQIPPRTEQVALTLGCSPAKAFWHVVLPQARLGISITGTMAWARSLGEFGPILIFAGATRMRTEVLSTSVFIEYGSGNLEAALAVSLLLVFVALVVLVLTRARTESGLCIAAALPAERLQPPAI